MSACHYLSLGIEYTGQKRADYTRILFMLSKGMVGHIYCNYLELCSDFIQRKFAVYLVHGYLLHLIFLNCTSCMVKLSTVTNTKKIQNMPFFLSLTQPI